MLSLYLRASSFNVFNLDGLRQATAPKKQPGRHLPRICCATTTFEQPQLRRSGNYHPNLWTDDYIQSLTTNLKVEDEEVNVRRISKLKEDVTKLICEKKELADQIQLIDHLQQLGVAYHFKDEIKDALSSMYGNLEDTRILLKDNLHATALLFRLLRENGHDVPQDIFNRFKDENGNFKASLRHQTAAMLSLYEASFLAKEGEEVLNEAMQFTTEHLRNFMRSEESFDLQPQYLRKQVGRALDAPLTWRIERAQTRWFIEAATTINPLLLELAKRDFNMVQSIYKKELTQLSKWWTELGLPQRLPFFRDRLMENYLWAVGWDFEPQLWRSRLMQTKSNCFITLIDDIYDVYGTLDELELFTDAVDRWDVNAIDKLPEYMKIAFLALFNMVHDAGYMIMKEKGLDVIPYLKRAWANQCKSYLVEAKWFHQGHTPRLGEYLDNAWTSISGPVILCNAYCLNKDLTGEALQAYSRAPPQIIKPSCMLLRLYDDLATTTHELERGDVQKSIQCCMKERGVSEAAAREVIRELIMDNWRAINGNRACSSSFEKYFKSVAINVPRTSVLFYHHGDGYADPEGETRDHVISLLLQPIKI